MHSQCMRHAVKVSRAKYEHESTTMNARFLARLFGRTRRMQRGANPAWQIAPTSKVHLGTDSVITQATVEDHASIGLLECNLSLFQLGRCSYGSIVRTMGLQHVLRIGRYCSMGNNVTFVCGAGYHRPERASTYPFPFRSPFKVLKPETLYPAGSLPTREINVGHDVWIGEGAMILSGVRIGNGAVIAAHALITKDVPDYALVAGNPGEIRKYRHSPELIAKLGRLAWWNWPFEKIISEAELFRLTSPELEAALDYHLRESSLSKPTLRP